MSFCLEPYLASLTRVEGLAALFAILVVVDTFRCLTALRWPREHHPGHAKTQMLTLREEVDQRSARTARGMFAGASDNGKIEPLCMMRQLSAALTSAQHATIDPVVFMSRPSAVPANCVSPLTRAQAERAS